MKGASDLSAVLSDWGPGTAGPVNGASGEKLVTLLVGLAAERGEALSICDLGCGNGYLADRLGRAGHQVFGVDASERQLKIARQHYATARVRFQAGLVGDELADSLSQAAPFDLVISSDVLEHLYRPRALVETASRILRPGGSLIVGTPYYGYAKNLAIGLLGKWDQHHGVHWDGGHVKFFSVRTLAALMESSGFAVDKFAFHGSVPWLWHNMVCVATKRT